MRMRGDAPPRKFVNQEHYSAWCRRCGTSGATEGPNPGEHHARPDCYRRSLRGAPTPLFCYAIGTHHLPTSGGFLSGSIPVTRPWPAGRSKCVVRGQVLLAARLASCMAVSLRTTWISRSAAAALKRLLATVAPRNTETDAPWLSGPVGVDDVGMDDSQRL